MKLYTDALHKIAYSTDASVYREVPYGVAFPESVGDIKVLLAKARELHTNIIPRAAGTSIAGQVVGDGIVADIGKHLNRIIEINSQERYAIVEPGVVRDELNLALKPYGLFFSPETSTSNRCQIGGMIGNNSCGTHSLIYGSTRHHLLEADVLLTDGTEEHLAEYTIAELEQRFGQQFWTNPHPHPERLPLPELVSGSIDSVSGYLIRQIYSQLINFALNPDTVQLIEQSYPDKSLKRRSCGYAIDEVIEDLHNEAKPLKDRTINLCRLLAGSEGTLALLTRTKLSLDPLPPQYQMVVCAHCKTLDGAFVANLTALKNNPTAIELMDGEILELSKTVPSVEHFFVKGDPAALLMVELKSESKRDLDLRAELLEKKLLETGQITLCTRVYGQDVQKVWNLRKAGVGILANMKGDAKPTGVIEDTAVAPERLPAYMADFQAMLKRLNTSCVFYGHISTGELHLRPILNLKSKEGRALFRQIAYETTLLVRKHRGTISGEHGDGRLRGEFIPVQYGERVYDLMRQVKKCWDSQAVLNPKKIIDTPPMDAFLRYQLEPQYPETDTYFNWKAAFDECRVEGATGAQSQAHAFICSIEQCNGSGDCRKSTAMGGTMCPAFKATGDETQTTRARANILREIISHCNPTPPLPSSLNEYAPLLKEVLGSCLACKGCKKDCPSGVDMTRLRAEVLQHLYDKRGIPFRTFLVARMAQVEQLGAIVPHLYNFFASNKITSAIIKSIVGFSQQRKIPTLSPISLKKYVKAPHSDAGQNLKTSKRRVYLFADEFTDLQEAELGITFVKLLRRLGYEVIVPNQKESGRAAISKGCLKLAKKYAEQNLALLKDIITDDTPLVGIEPSCILTFRDEYPDLVAPERRKKAQELGKHCLLYDEFLWREVEAGRISADDFNTTEVEIWLHGHCHQKALVGIEKTATLLSLPKNAKVNVIPSGCCGMAGSFGYEKKHYKESIAIGEQILFPTIRKAFEKTKPTDIGELSTSSLQHPTPNIQPPTSNIQRPTSDLQHPTSNDRSPKLSLVAAPGTSCRTQIFDGTGIRAHHPIEILYALLKK